MSCPSFCKLVVALLPAPEPQSSPCTPNGLCSVSAPPTPHNNTIQSIVPLVYCIQDTVFVVHTCSCNKHTHHTHTNTRALHTHYTHSHMRACTHTHTCARYTLHTCMYAQHTHTLHTCVYAHTHSHMRATHYTHACTHNTHTHTTHTHTCVYAACTSTKTLYHCVTEMSLNGVTLL